MTVIKSNFLKLNFVQQIQRNCKPIVLPVAGMFVGSIANIAANYSLIARKGIGCDLTIGIRQLNNLKQWEVKKVLGLGGLLTPAILTGVAVLANIAHQLRYDAVHVKNDKCERKKFSALNQAQKALSELSLRDVFSASTALFLAICAKKGLRNITPNLDPSGHVMVKSAAALGMISSLEYIEKMPSKPARTFLKVMADVSIYADFFFLAITANCNHSPVDLLTGSLTAAAILIVADKTADHVMPVAKKVSSYISRWKWPCGN